MEALDQKVLITYFIDTSTLKKWHALWSSLTKGMAMFNNINFKYPEGHDQPPVCFSADVLENYQSADLINDFLNLTPQERREGLAGSRNNDYLKSPKSLYKYRSFNTKDINSINLARSIITKNRIWIASAEKLNDPRDLRFNLNINQNAAEKIAWAKRHTKNLNLSPANRLKIERQLVKANPTSKQKDELAGFLTASVGVFCASKDPRNILMWSHYADSQKGICIQLDTTEDEIFLLAKNVIYSEKFPSFTLPTTLKEDDKYLHKSIHWNYEKEQRIVFPKHSFSLELRPKTVRAVIIGPNAPRETAIAIEKLAEERLKAGHPQIKIYQATANNNEYKIAIWRK